MFLNFKYWKKIKTFLYNALKGQVVNLHTGGETAPNLTCVQHLNLPDEYWETMHSLPMHMLKKSISEEIPVTELVLQDEDIESIKLKG